MNPPFHLDGVTTVESPYSVDITLSRLEALIKAKGLILFAHIDHGAGASEAGLHMPPAHVLIFGHAKAGTPLMIVRPLLALDLPLRVLVWEDAQQKVWVSHATPECLAQRYKIPDELIKNISGVASLVAAALA